MKEKYLPLGTVVLLKGATKKLMVTGFCAITPENKDKVFDYSGCMYPEGFVTTDQIALFDHEQIERILFEGYSDEEEQDFKIKLNGLVKEYSTKTESVPKLEL